MSAILVTGAAGFIGSHVCQALLARGESVVGVDDLNDYYCVAQKRANVAELSEHSRFAFVQADITDEDALETAFARQQLRAVAHLAARAGVRPSIRDPALYIRVNVVGTVNVLEASRRHGVPHFVFTSSSSVYGNSPRIPYREEDSATDRPISPYAATKKAGEVLCHTYHTLHGMSVNVVRPFTIYGPRGRPDMAPWLFVAAALEGRPIRQFGDGSSSRDYTFIDDFVRGFIAALDRPLGFEIFNLGNSSAVRLDEFIRTVEAATERRLRIESLPPQPGDVQCTLADLTKSRDRLDYQPSTPLSEGLARFVAWYRHKRLG